MSSKKLAKKVLITTLSASMVLPFGSAVYANTQALPNGTIVTENGVGYLKDSNGEKYSGWFFDSNDEWYYFNETNKAMKKGWHHDDKDGYWYYLNSSNGKMATGWQKIDGKEYFFQPVRDMGNYHFNNEQEKWLYSMNSKVPYGAMYVSTTTPDGFKVDGSGAKVAEETAAQSGNTNASSGTQTTKNGWVSENGSWHYYENGTMAKDKWLNVSGKWYYVVSDGSMVSGTWKEISGKSYYFGSDGVMYVSTTTPDGSKVDSNGAKVTEQTTTQTGNGGTSSSTQTVKNGWVSENGSWHYYENGTLAKNKWLNVSGKWYYVVSDGSMISNTWKEIGGKSYYFGADGAMYVNTTTPDGKKVNQLGVVIEEEVKPTKINYANTLEGTFIPTAEYESYKWWTENGDTVINDERIKYYGYNDYDRMALAVTYYPELEDLYWTETSIGNNEFLTTAEQGFMGKFLIGGSIIWKGNDIATLVYDRNSGSGELKVLDNNTIQINGDKLIRVN